VTDAREEPTEPEVPKGLKLLREIRAKAAQLPPEQKATAEEAAIFVGPIGTDDDGQPLPGLTEAQRQHKADILAGRKQPGDPIGD
jgi:hypothetical protein